MMARNSIFTDISVIVINKGLLQSIILTVNTLLARLLPPTKIQSRVEVDIQGDQDYTEYGAAC